MQEKNKKFLYTSKKPIIAFFFFLSLAWIIPSINLIIQGNFTTAFKLLIFGFSFLVVLFLIQIYFKKMIMLYQKNLEISANKFKAKKKIKK